MSSALKMVDRNEVVGASATRRTNRAKKVTLGDLVAAAFDATGGDVRKAKTLLTSRELSRALGRRIVLV